MGVLFKLEMDNENENYNQPMKGWLYKWTNYLKGYKKRWFVLTNDKLSYYRKSEEVAHTQRGTLNLLDARIYTYNETAFLISSGTNSAVLYLKASNKTERDMWVVALKKTKAQLIVRNEQSMDPKHNLYWNRHGSSHMLSQRDILTVTDQSLGDYIAGLNNYYDLIAKYGKELRMNLINLENINIDQVHEEKRKITTAADLFHITSHTMIAACIGSSELVEVKYRIIHNWLRTKSKTKPLKEFVKKLNTIHVLLLTCIREGNECKARQIKSFILSTIATHNVVQHKRVCCSTTNISGQLDNTVESEDTEDRCDSDYNIEHNDGSIPDDLPKSLIATYNKSSYFKVRDKPLQRRTRIPDRPNKPANLWSILKNCIGKDLSKIPMPVNFSEPISLLQRLAEDYNYSMLLDQAALCQDSTEQLAILAVFTISCYSSTAIRTNKPFNPLLGETFEWDRSDDYGWKLISEQVSHHPPIAAQHCESREWSCWQESAISAKFRGKYITVNPLGISHIVFHKSGNHYTWKKVVTTINNIIIGKLWVDNSGQMTITNLTDSSVCNVNFFPYSIFRSEEQRKIAGVVIDSKKEVKWLINGKWDTEVTISPVLNIVGNSEPPNYTLGPSRTIWRAQVLSPESQNYYNFSLFACQLNEMEEDIAPTDSRNRPDQRLMEEGEWDEANALKIRLEEKQRASRRQYEECSNSKDDNLTISSIPKSTTDNNAIHNHEPLWFKRELDPLTGRITYIYRGNYWEAKSKQEWSACPDIFNLQQQ